MAGWQSFHDAWWRLATQDHPSSYSDLLASSVLQLGSIAYQAAITVRNSVYDRGWARAVRLPCRVVSVGNLTVGGTGKTTCVELITRKLTAAGQRVAILSRGYGGARPAYWLRGERGRLVVNGDAQAMPDGLADEPQLLARHLEGIPILVGAKRSRTGQQALAMFGVDTIILDDGFQHRRVARDCEIVLVHARMPLAGWPLLPRGPMREPLESLRRAHVIIVTKADEALETLGALQERLRSFNPDATRVTAMHEPVALRDAMTGTSRDVRAVSGWRVGLLSSIGDPGGFEATVRRLYATVIWHWRFPDHHRYEARDWQSISQQAQETRPDAVITTEKDFVRLGPWLAFALGGSAAQGTYGFGAVPLWVLEIRMKLLSGEAELDDRLARLYGR